MVKNVRKRMRLRMRPLVIDTVKQSMAKLIASRISSNNVML